MKQCFCFILISFLLVFSCYSQKQVAINTELKNNSERWQAKIKRNKNFKLFKGKINITLYQFGPYKISQYEIDTLKSTKKRAFLEFSPLFRDRKISSYSSAYRLVISNATDSVNIIFYRWLTSIKERKGIIDFGKKEDSFETYIDSITAWILINNDSTEWKFVSGPAPFANQKIKGSFNFRDDQYTIESINLWSGKDRPPVFGNASLGATIKNTKDECLAAVQLEEKKFVWLKNGLAPELKLVMASYLILVLCNLEF